jgi:hypothetical protein
MLAETTQKIVKVDVDYNERKETLYSESNSRRCNPRPKPLNLKMVVTSGHCRATDRFMESPLPILGVHHSLLPGLKSYDFLPTML